MNNIIAIVVTYNRLNMLKQSIYALENQTRPCDILIIDNLSTDSTRQWVEDYAKSKQNILYYNTGENIGGAGGFNLGMKIALEKGYEYIWLMDDDTVVTTDALEQLCNADKILNGDYGFLSSMVLWKDGKQCLMNRQDSKKKFFEHIDNLDKGLISIDQATFVSVLFPSSVVKMVGFPIKEYFIWNDDIEYTRRVSIRHDMPCYLVAKSKVTHMMSTNNGSNIAIDTVERIPRYRYAYRNESFTYRQEGLSGIVYYLARCLKHSIKILLLAKNHRIKRLWFLVEGFIDGIFFNPKIEVWDNNDK